MKKRWNGSNLKKILLHGKEEDTERTFIEIYSIYELINNNLVDWTTRQDKYFLSLDVQIILSN